ncbi:DUF2235 domain-containing protein [uncultured Deefgea sp.]|uniref:T6SS phospholipase effector Tle1-like catalytic domain-containing protein n=1 Tax=uncultured Deefgea sp. TaxID=1304914 RepID=UPI0026303288|nr:DUF2235 domain-containing protein [uncultured Deefgea sp.]
MNAISAPLFPAQGLRALSAKETLQRASALSCSADKKPSCTGQVFIGIFFDGTGNNREADYLKPPPLKRKHSNVVRLFQAYRDSQADGYFAEYIPGVGTPFPEIGDTGGNVFGGSAAFKGDERMIWAFTRLINAPHSFVIGKKLIEDPQAGEMANNVGSLLNIRNTVFNTWQDKLKAALAGRKPTITQLNVSVFGFSRGAAEARAFVNWLFKVCKQEGGGWTFAGIPIRLHFLGLFDTVASVGVANLFEVPGGPVGHQGWADDNLQIHPAVEQCVHYVAAHEVRACFPLDSARIGSRYPTNVMEVLYPGAHSDVGGGYAAGDLGVSLEQKHQMCVIPAVNMYQAARQAGVPLLPMDRLSNTDKNALTPSAEAIKAFNAYMRAAKVASAPIEVMLQNHMAHYFSFRLKAHARFAATAPWVNASVQHRNYLGQTQQCLIQRLASLGADPRNPGYAPHSAAQNYEKLMKSSGLALGDKERKLIEVAKKMNLNALNEEMEHFLANYIHDSMAGFIAQLNEYSSNSIGIMKFRTVFHGND